jgi:hypothetical protein
VIRLPFGDAAAVVDPADGAILALEHPARPSAPWLLDEATESWHTREHRWGTGLLITSAGAGRWGAPRELTVDGGRVEALYDVAGLQLRVTRELGASWRERYALRNTAAAPVTVGCWGICTPWRDLYASAADALERAVHAHVHAGGAYSYVLAEPMDGAGPVLGLALREGELWAYSIESREPTETGSNARGHILLHATDAARAPHAFGGQPEPAIAPGGELVLAWELAWHADRAAFVAAHPAPFEVPELVAEGDHGETYVQRGRSRVAIARHAPLGEVVRGRVRFILDHQRATHRAGAAAGALLPYDTERGLTVPGAGWNDLSDGRERLGMGLLLQEALRHGHAEDPGATAEAAAAFRCFVTDCLLTETHELRADSHRPGASPRLYDVPWLVLLLAEHDPDRALAALRGFYARGGERFLAIGAGLAARELAAALRAGGRDDEAAEVDGLLCGHAHASIAAGDDLPAHEVNYEQSMVAPLLEILCAARASTAEPAEHAELDEAIAHRLPWLLAFGGPQPHARLRDIAIRHWDGYWFGREMLWGDTFPHHWSALTANVLLMLPGPVAAAFERERGEPPAALARRIYAANLIDFAPDGTATAAFVFPSCVSGRAAHRADPLANDQDWTLYWPLLFERRRTSTAAG